MFDIVVAICDKEILGNKIRFGNIEINVSENFYKGKEISEEIALRLIEKATIANLIGNKIVNLAKSKGLIKEENVLMLNGIAHAQIIKLNP